MIFMNRRYLTLTRRNILSMGGAAIGINFFPSFASSMQSESTNLRADSMALFYKPATTHLWDTWIYHHNGRYHLYYVTMKKMDWWDGVGMAVSDDGVYWKEVGKIIEKPKAGVESIGAGMVWAVRDETGKEKFIMSHSEFLLPEGEPPKEEIPLNYQRRISLPDHMVFFESEDLFHWKRLPPEYESLPDPRWYDPKGRWDNLLVVPRKAGGFYGYWKAAPLDGKGGIGFGESDDGIKWNVLKPAVLSGAAISPEVSGVYMWGGKYYAMVSGAALLNLSAEEIANPSIIDWKKYSSDECQIGMMIADSPSGPFTAAPKNPRFLVGNASYFSRFIDSPDGVLVCHHSWEIDESYYRDTPVDRINLAPLKRADWDEEGTLRMKWWRGNEKAKTKFLHLKSQLLETVFDPEKTLILEGVIRFTASVTGLYLEGDGGEGTGFFVHQDGLVEYGGINQGGLGFEKKGAVDRELAFKDEAQFRLIRKGRITEFYLNDYLMQCYCLPERGTGRIGVIGPTHGFDKLKAWYCA